jgi:hypothetical protein
MPLDEGCWCRGQEWPGPAVSLLYDPFGHLAEHRIENLVSQVYRFLDRRPRRNHTHVDLLLPRQPQTRNDACAQVNQGAIQPRHTSVRIEHDQPSVGATVFP